MEALADSLKLVSDWLTAHITMWVLVATGLFLTLATRGVQLRRLPDMPRQVRGLILGSVFVSLSAGPQVWSSPGASPATLTTVAVAHGLGGWTVLAMAVLVLVLACSSISAAYVYPDVNMSYLTGGKPWASWLAPAAAVVSAAAGSVLSLRVVWNAADSAMAVMTLISLIALVWLYRWVVGALQDYESQRRQGVAEPVFHGKGNIHLPADAPCDVWGAEPQSLETCPGRKEP